MKRRREARRERGRFPGLVAAAGVFGWFWFAASCAPSPACGGALPNLEASEEPAAAPMVVRVDAWAPPPPEEAAVLADRMLRRESDDLLLDAGRRRRAIREAERALARLRGAHPEVADVPAREDHRPGVLLLGLAPDLFAAVSGLLEAGGGPVALRTGDAAFDALNRHLGLWGVRLFPATGVVAMYFNEHLNVDAARRAYGMMGGVRHAAPDARLGDGSDVAASRSGGTWRLVARKARGDCPSGCLREELLFFTLRGGEVERVEPARAMGMLGFAELIARRGWR